MKKPLLFFIAVVFQALNGNVLMCQTVLLSENFAGFTSVSHDVPSTIDVSTSLDTRTEVPGWSGSKIYPAPGEIKISTGTVPGWIETPLIDLSGYEGKFRVKFDICSWPGDAATVQVLLNGTAIGSNLTPGESYETMTIDATGGTKDSRIKIQAVTKRFYLDNFSVTVNNLLTGIDSYFESLPDIKIYPVPARNVLNFENVQDIGRIEICDLSGKPVMIIENRYEWSVEASIGDLEPGIYILRLFFHKGILVRKFMKL